MKWPRNWLDTLKDVSAAEPIQCPRGWGEVCFQISLGGFPPFFDISRKCPIGGTSECVSCRYPVKPEDAQRLRQNLEELDTLRKEGVLSEPEYAARRRMIVGLVERKTGPPGEGCRITAWILGPAGVILTAAGVWLGRTVDQELWVMAGIGMAMLALTVSFTAIALTKRQPRDDTRSTSTIRRPPLEQ
jgi:hypothetical protein